MTDRLQAVAALRAAAGGSRSARETHVTTENVASFHAAPGAADTVAEALTAMGFTITGKGLLAVSFAGARDLFERWFGVTAGPAGASGATGAPGPAGTPSPAGAPGATAAASLPVPKNLQPYVERVTLAKGVRFFGGGR